VEEAEKERTNLPGGLLATKVKNQSQFSKKVEFLDNF